MTEVAEAKSPETLIGGRVEACSSDSIGHLSRAWRASRRKRNTPATLF